ncbi:MAG: YbhB/YbcL family Raf kinase inhibitor-like protein [Anaerolineales bacterium]
MPFELSSPAFEGEGIIPDRYSCKGEDISPELRWGDPPAGTQSYAIVFDDPDAGGGGWVHWVAYNIPPDARAMPEAVPSTAVIRDSAVHGANSWGSLQYRGPCPSQGSTHRYLFKLYALDAMLDLEPGAGKRELLAAMEGHILAEVELAANFTR